MKLKSNDLYTGFLFKKGNYKIAPDYSESEDSKNYVVWNGQKVIRRFNHYDDAKRYVLAR
tara:strand:- start:53 stop:232 length:180 start_codon:yes stop_codon:yes gene_type:complete